MLPAAPRARLVHRLIPASLALVSLATASTRAHAATPRVHAIVGARIVTAPGQAIPHGTIVMRDGVIVAVGAAVTVPPDARVWAGDSLTLYPGLVDAFVMPAEAPGAPGAAAPPGRPAPPAAGAPRGAAHELAAVRPETRMVENLPLAKDQLEALRAAGFTAAQVAPRRGIVRGTSAIIGLGDGSPNANLVVADAAQVLALEPALSGYPGSLMGAIAVIRQALLDARWYHEVQGAYRKSPLGRPRPEENVSWAALEPLVDNRQPALFVADEMLEVLRAGAIAREAGLTAVILGAGDEYKRAKPIAAAGFPLIVPVNFPEPPDVSDEGNALDVTTEELRHWDQAPGNPAVLVRAGATFALTANGMKDVKGFRANVVKAIGRGLTADQALAAVTTTPARLLGLSDRLGTLAPGKIANLTVTRGELFSERGKVREVWVDGNRYETTKDDAGPKGNWTIRWGGGHHTLMVGMEKDTTVRLVLGADTLEASRVRVDGTHLRFRMRQGEGPPEDFDLALANDALQGTLSVTGVGAHPVTGSRLPDAPKPDAAKEKKDEPIATPVVLGNTEAWRASPPARPDVVLVRDATIWTAGPRGTLEHADLLVRGGKIAAVGPRLAAPSGAVVIDGRGRHVAPGIIDCHSHSAILGNVNECTNSVTAEVRIQDVVNSESVNIYRQLASGNTVMHLLHGSCNAIGGQCAVIKDKWGELPDQLLFAAAPPTIKFALGENPKQSNWGVEATGRYPQTRSGVEETIRDAFTRARDYQAASADWKAHRRAAPPRRDLQLDAVSEILEGRRFVHCHSYRQDEILMLMRLAEEFGVRIQTFQHVLEGYKVADEMATHGAGGSCFSDWWAYKYEVIDAIPTNGYLMWDRGVTVSYNSDSDELARHLNTEAAKAIKYGGVPPEEAIKFVTLNPAKQLRIESRVGSLEVGKDADFAVWNGSPLSPYSLCEQTWIEGRKYFDRAADLEGRAALARERDALIAKARAAKKEGGGGGAHNWPPRYLDDTDLSGNDCGGEQDHRDAFRSETLRRALQQGEVQR
jgi:imidazolonepropionase-like amidohydrolase